MNLTIYSTADCSECHALKSWLDKQGISYVSKITDESPDAMVEFMAVSDGMISVPLTVIDGGDGQQIKITGFRPAQFKEALGIA